MLSMRLKSQTNKWQLQAMWSLNHLTPSQILLLGCQHLTTSCNNNKQGLVLCTSAHRDRDLDTGQLNTDWYDLGQIMNINEL